MTCQCRKSRRTEGETNLKLRDQGFERVDGLKIHGLTKIDQRVVFSRGGVTTTFGIELVDLAPVMTFISVGSALQPKPTIRRTYDSFFAKKKCGLWRNAVIHHYSQP